MSPIRPLFCALALGLALGACATPPEGQAAGTVGVYKDIRNPLVMRTREQVRRFFDGFELVEPGLVAMPRWRPDGSGGSAGGDPQEDPYAFSGFGGVGLKR